MNKYLLGGIAGAAMLFGSMGAAFADNCSRDSYNRWMRVYNRTGLSAFYIYARPARSNYRWSRDLLGAHTVPAHHNRGVEFDYCNRSCVLDIRIVSRRRPDGSRRTWRFYDINVCRQSRLNLY